MRTERTVLAVVHNLTAANRLLDVLPLAADDPRVQVEFGLGIAAGFGGELRDLSSTPSSPS